MKNTKCFPTLMLKINVTQNLMNIIENESSFVTIFLITTTLTKEAH